MENGVSTAHYYGDEVRQFFLAGAFIMVAALPFVHALIDQPVVFSILAILILVVAAGLTNPKQLSTAILNALIAIAAVIVLELYAISAYGASGIVGLFFWLNQMLAIDFLIALYFAIKTIRGKLV